MSEEESGPAQLFEPAVQSLPGKKGEALEMVELRTGWMVKQGRIRRSWRRRFFVLQGGTLLGRLDYFKHERRGWKGAVSLLRAQPAETVAAPPKARGLYCFTIRTATRDWLIGAETEEDRSVWIAAINAVLAHLRDPARNPLALPPPAGSSAAAAPGDGASATTTSTTTAGAQAAAQGSAAAGAAAARAAKRGGSGADDGDEEDEDEDEDDGSTGREDADAPEYMLSDPVGDRRRHEELKQCRGMAAFVERERALRRESRDTVPLGRLISVSFPRECDGATGPTGGSSSKEEEGEEGNSDADKTSTTTTTTTAAAEMLAAESDAASAGEASTVALSALLVEWGSALAAHAARVAAAPTTVLGRKGLPAVVFADADNCDAAGRPRERDVRYVLLAFSEAFDKAVAGTPRRRVAPADVARCRGVLDAWAAALRALAATGPAEALALGLHARLGADSPLALLPPATARRIARWAVPALATATATDSSSSSSGNSAHGAAVVERQTLAQMAAEKAFMARHIERLLACGPVRFGFVTVCVPARAADDFARLAGRAPAAPYAGALPAGRLFCELTHESLCFTAPGDGAEVVVPLLWIRKLEVETARGCYMKFTRYLTQPSADTQLESRVLHADNSPETYNWLSDITRAFAARRRAEQQQQGKQ